MVTRRTAKMPVRRTRNPATAEVARDVSIDVHRSRRKQGYDVVSVVTKRLGASEVIVIAEGMTARAAIKKASAEAARYTSQGVRKVSVHSDVSINPAIDIFHKKTGAWLGETTEYANTRDAVAGEKRKNGMVVTASLAE